MTKGEKLIASCYTGVLFVDLSDFLDYASKLLGRPVKAQETANTELWRALQDRTEEAFKLMCENEVVDTEKKCSWGEGEQVTLFGHEVDPCVYEVMETHHGCKVEVSKCKYCGHIDISWEVEDNYGYEDED